MLPVLPTTVNKLIQDESGNLSTYPFPENCAGEIPQPMRKQIFQWMLTNYIWPQIMQRRPYERQWDKLLEMSLASWKYSELDIDENTRVDRERKRRILGGKDKDSDTPLKKRIEIADTIIFDAVDRLNNLNHFIAFKESLPVRYEIPEDMIFPYENDVYSPMSSLIRSANCWLRFNAQNQNVYRKYWMTGKHHYTYGVSFVDSQFTLKIDDVPRRQADKSFAMMKELTQIGITFEPMSIRKLWLNPRLTPYEMDYQPCPFFFEEVPRFAIVANPYQPETNPFGFVNLESLPAAQMLFGTSETDSLHKAFQTAYPNAEISFTDLTPPELGIELLWTFYAMIPLIHMDEVGNLPATTQDKIIEKMQNMTEEEQRVNYIFDYDGTLHLPLRRYIVQTFGNNLTTGMQEIIRLQRNFYPNDSLPLYGSAHMPSLDHGTYSPAIGTILEDHYKQICKAMLQYIENKDWINDPPTEVVTTSPAMSQDINAKGNKIPVNTVNDLKRREPYDATQTTPAFLENVREQAKTSAKIVDAVLGKAMGSRTSASEATNVFQTAMSGVTTDVNMFVHDIMGGWATRVWDYTGRWIDPDVLAAITGSYGFAIKPEHMALRIGLRWDVGSSFIESITRQQNIRYALESSNGDPSINRAPLWRELLSEWRFKDVDRIVNDGGLEDSIQISTEQTIQTYLGQLVLVDPDQNHQIAIKVKKSFLADRNSVWNTNPQYAAYGPRLVTQIQQHQLYLQLQMYQQMLAMQQQTFGAGGPPSLQPLQTPTAPPPALGTPGLSAQMGGGMVG